MDLDKLSPSDLQLAFNKAAALPYTFCCFRSPSGSGLKILSEVTSTQEHHLEAYNQLADYYQTELNLPIDRSGKDISRLCFVADDELAYRNINNEKFLIHIIGITPAKIELPPTSVATSIEEE